MELISLLAVLGALLGGLTLKAIEHGISRRSRSLPAADERLALSNILNDADIAWVNATLSLAGMKPEVIRTCACGFASECAMHCNHEQRPDLCPGPRYAAPKPPAPVGPASGSQWSGKFRAIAIQQPELLSWQRERTLSDNEIDAFKKKIIDKRNAKLKAEFQALDKSTRNTTQTVEALRKRIDEREIKLRKYEQRLERLAKSVTPPKPMYLSQPTSYDPKKDSYTVYGRKVSRQMMEDLIYNGHLTPQQVREILAPEYDTLEAVHVWGQREPVAYIDSSRGRAWTERRPAR